MNKEPVAYVDNVWINRPDLAIDLGIGQMFSRCQLSDHQIPLYTHPAKTLTDEEITDIASTLLIATDSIEYEWGVCVVEFAKAILRKAQE